MSEGKHSTTAKMQKRIWMLMHYGADGWIPSMDFAFPWRTKKAAQKKIRSLGNLGKNYKAFRFDLRKG